MKKIIKPTDDELRKQIKLLFFVMWLFFGYTAFMFIIGFNFLINLGLIGALMCFISQKQDKMRLEIRELNRKIDRDHINLYKKIGGKL